MSSKNINVFRLDTQTHTCPHYLVAVSSSEAHVMLTHWFFLSSLGFSCKFRTNPIRNLIQIDTSVVLTKNLGMSGVLVESYNVK